MSHWNFITIIEIYTAFMVVFLSDFYAEDRKIFPIVESPDCPDFFTQLDFFAVQKGIKEQRNMHGT